MIILEYVPPIVGAVTYWMLMIPEVAEVFEDLVPNYYFNAMVKGLIIVSVLFIASCVILK